MAETTATIRSASDFEPTPTGLAERWEQELAAADKAVEKWHEQAKKVEDRYQDERGNATGKDSASKLNLFHSDIETSKALVYDNEPKVHARRRYADADDDVARVSAEMIERHLNADIERTDDGFISALEMARDDRLLAGLGMLRFRYVVEWEDVPEQPAKTGPCPHCQGTGHVMQAQDPMTPPEQMPCPACQGAGHVELAPAIPASKKKLFEDVESDHVVWEDFRWSPCRNKNELRWVAFGAELTLDEARTRFPDVDVEKLPVSSRREDVSPENRDTWSRIKVWEIWDRITRTRYLHVRGYNEILESEPDPLGLIGFYPCPRPMMANSISRKYMPVPDFVLAQDLYDEIDRLTDRISKLVDFARVVGACDKGNEAVAQVLNRAKEGQIIPVEGFGALLGQGIGSQPPVWMLDLEPIVNAINALVVKRQESIQQLYQVTGNSEMMRGGGQVKTATQSRMEGRFGASRTRSRQKELARFAQEAQRVRAQIIAKWFDAETIIKRSNIEAAETMELPPQPAAPPTPGAPPPPPAPVPPKKAPNRPLIDQAVQLLKSDISAYRIEIAEDSLAMTDYDAVKQERTELISALGGFFQAMLPILQDPQQRPYVMRLAQWLVSGMRGASQAEAVLDEAVRAAEVAAAQRSAQPAPPNPQLEVAQVKAQAEMTKAKTGVQQTMVDAQAHQAKTTLDVQAAQAKHGMEMQKLHAQVEASALQHHPMPEDPGALDGTV